MGEMPEELAIVRAKLQHFVKKSRETSGELADLAGRAEDGIRSIDFLQSSWPDFDETPGFYTTASGVALKAAVEDALTAIGEGGELTRSARGRIQTVVSGSTGLVTSAAQQLYSSWTVKSEPVEIPNVRNRKVEDQLDQALQALMGDDQVGERRRGAWETFDSGGEDHLAQAAHSMREILTILLDTYARNESVKEADWWIPNEDTRDGVSKRQKVRYFIHGEAEILDPIAAEEVQRQVQQILDSHTKLIKIAHGQADVGREVVRSYLVALQDAIQTLLALRESHDAASAA